MKTLKITTAYRISDNFVFFADYLKLYLRLKSIKVARSLNTMFNFRKNRIAKKIYLMPDVSNQNIYDVSQGNVDLRVTSPLTPDQKIDQETVNLINWLAQEQGISPEVALKKAVVTAAYIHDVVYKQRGKLLVQYPDGSIREIFLK